MCGFNWNEIRPIHLACVWSLSRSQRMFPDDPCRFFLFGIYQQLQEYNITRENPKCYSKMFAAFCFNLFLNTCSAGAREIFQDIYCFFLIS